MHGIYGGEDNVNPPARAEAGRVDGTRRVRRIIEVEDGKGQTEAEATIVLRDSPPRASAALTSAEELLGWAADVVDYPDEDRGTDTDNDNNSDFAPTSEAGDGSAVIPIRGEPPASNAPAVRSTSRPHGRPPGSCGSSRSGTPRRSTSRPPAQTARNKRSAPASFEPQSDRAVIMKSYMDTKSKAEQDRLDFEKLKWNDEKTEREAVRLANVEARRMAFIQSGMQMGMNPQQIMEYLMLTKSDATFPQ